MQATSASSLFQSTASLQIGLSRASKAARTAKGAEYGAPIWLGRKQEDLEALAEGAAGADGGADKVLALEVERDGPMNGSAAWIATSGGLVRRVDLETGRTTHSVRAHSAPVSALCLFPISSTSTLLITGSWDKSIKFWAVPPFVTGALASKDIKAATLQLLITIKDASSDFIKALHPLPSPGAEVLLSGGSDKIIRVWDLCPLKAWVASFEERQRSTTAADLSQAPEPAMLHAFREHTRPITCFASLPVRPSSVEQSTAQSAASTQLIYSADSMGKVLELELDLKRAASSSARLDVRRELVGSATGVVDLCAGWSAEEDEDEHGEVRWTAELWTASHDKTARLYLLQSEAAPRGSQAAQASGSAPSAQNLGRLPALCASRKIEHSNYVKIVFPLAHLAVFSSSTFPEALRDVLVTGETDGDLRVWNLSSRGAEGDGDQSDTRAGQQATRRTVQGDAIQTGPGARQIRTLEAHWHEVIVVRPWWRKRSGPLLEANEAGPEREDNRVHSRNSHEGEWWLVTAGLDGSVRRWRVAEIVKASPLPDQLSNGGREPQKPHSDSSKGASKEGLGMTEDEERELQDLMDED